MNPNELPLVGWILESGPDDRVFDALLLTGPLVIALIAVVGRSVVSEAVAVAYLAAILWHVLANWLDRR